MRMAELSAESGVPVATVKYYLREGLLPAGERTSPNQARYSAAHVQRLKLIRALTDVGGLSLASVGAVLAAIDGDETPYEVMGVVQHELAGDLPDVPEDPSDEAFELLAAALRRHGWHELKRGPAVQDMIATMVTVRELGHDRLLDQLEAYVRLALSVAEADMETVKGLGSVDRIIEAGVVGTVLGDRLFAGLRHLAQEMLSRELLSARPS